VLGQKQDPLRLLELTLEGTKLERSVLKSAFFCAASSLHAAEGEVVEKSSSAEDALHAGCASCSKLRFSAPDVPLLRRQGHMPAHA
jgi:hypothetical protein